MLVVYHTRHICDRHSMTVCITISLHHVFLEACFLPASEVLVWLLWELCRPCPQETVLPQCGTYELSLGQDELLGTILVHPCLWFTLSALFVTSLPRRFFQMKLACSVPPAKDARHTKGAFFSFEDLFLCVQVFCLHVYLFATEAIRGFWIPHNCPLKLF